VDLEATKWTNDDVNDGDFLKKGDILFSHINSYDHLAKTALFNKNDLVVHGANLLRLRPDKSKILPDYASYIFKTDFFRDSARRYAQRAVNQASINSTSIKNLEIPLPPIEVQREIVAELDGYQRIINAAQEIVKTYKPTIKINPDWEFAELGNITRLVRGPFGGSLKKEIFKPTGYKVYEQGDAIYGNLDETRYFVDETKFNEMKRFQVVPNDLIMSCSGTIGRVTMIKSDSPEGIINQALLKITPTESILPAFLKVFFESDRFQNVLSANSQGGVINNVVSVNQLSKLQVPLPPIETQREIVTELEAEQKLIDANKKLIEIYKQKIKSKIAEVWGE
jgi:restriction endonuclease S subunit